MTEARARPFPVAFFGHGSPQNTLATNAFTDAWRAFGATLRRPRAIVVISAHWYVPGTRVTAAARPKTIHDFNARFAHELFEFEYPAAGDAELARRLADILAPAEVVLDATGWGIDHGAYGILAHLFPAADVPVVQLSLDRLASPQRHYELARRLAPLRDEDVFIMGSGNLIHNLELSELQPRQPPFAWAERFDEWLLAALAAGDHAKLVAYARLGPDARLSIPTPEHYLPLLYALAVQRPGETVATIAEGFDLPGVGMRSVRIGG